MYLVNLSPIFILIFCGAPAVVSAGDGEGSALRMHQIYETTSWDLLEDLYLYHNAIRYFHESSGLRFNRTLTDYARLKALILSWYDGDAPAEGGNIRFGENLYWTNRTDSVNASDIIEEWYFNEEPKWNYDDPHVSDETRDFSQLVWNSTQRFGCGQAVSRGPKGGTYTVCYYDPPGNEAGKEKENVFRPNYGQDGGDQQEAQSSSGGTTSAPVTEASPAVLRAYIQQERSLGSGIARGDENFASFGSFGQ